MAKGSKSSTLVLREEKKGSVRYDNGETDATKAVTNSLYVNKSALPTPFPAKLTVTVAWE